ncbi:MAG: AAA family ATPase [Calditrichaeota bacterium]|nr:MAG: AAA family ATPase [Calditrichota bacterium]
MYEHFYNLNEPPFSLTPDPKYLYLSQGHKEAYSQLLLGLRLRRGFVVLTGEVGTGKTTILRAVMQEIDENASKAFIFHTLLSAKGLLQNICNEFQIDTAGLQNKTEYVIKLQEFLGGLNREGHTAILMIDEAHNLKEEVLEEIRLLSNIETNDEKALQIFLVGQPELKEKLKKPGLRQLDQRISMRFHLTKLSLDETGKYIQHRIHVAGANPTVSVFSKEAVKKIHKISEGIPRKINTICENALIMGYVKGIKQISSDIITAIGFGDSYQEISMDEFTATDAEFVMNNFKKSLDKSPPEKKEKDWFNFEEFGDKEKTNEDDDMLMEEKMQKNVDSAETDKAHSQTRETVKRPNTERPQKTVEKKPEQPELQRDQKTLQMDATGLPSIRGKQSTLSGISPNVPPVEDKLTSKPRDHQKPGYGMEKPGIKDKQKVDDLFQTNGPAQSNQFTDTGAPKQKSHHSNGATQQHGSQGHEFDQIKLLEQITKSLFYKLDRYIILKKPNTTQFIIYILIGFLCYLLSLIVAISIIK